MSMGVIVVMVVIAMLVMVMVITVVIVIMIMVMIMIMRGMIMRRMRVRAGLGRMGVAARIGAAFGIERRLDLDDARAEPRHHRLDNVIAPDPEAL